MVDFLIMYFVDGLGIGVAMHGYLLLLLVVLGWWVYLWVVYLRLLIVRYLFPFGWLLRCCFAWFRCYLFTSLFPICRILVGDFVFELFCLQFTCFALVLYVCGSGFV